MKRIAFALSLLAVTAAAAPLSAQSRTNGPWWDPSNTAGRTTDGRTTDGRTTDRRDDRVYNDGRIYDQGRADGQWHRQGRDRNGIIYARTRYDSNRNLIRERAHRDRLGRYRVFDRDVIRYANRGNNRNNDDRYDNNRRRGDDRSAQSNRNRRSNGKNDNRDKDRDRDRD